MLIDCLGTENTNAKKTVIERQKQRWKEHSPLRLKHYVFSQGFFEMLSFVSCGLQKDGEKKIAFVREMKLQNTQYCKVGYFPSHKAKATPLL